MTVTVITPALPTRLKTLAECAASVAVQTLKPNAHLVGIDHHRKGAGATRNLLARGITTEWLAFLDDDDLLYPNHLELLVREGERAHADLVYPYCDVQGRDGWNPSRPFDPVALEQGNYIPVTVLIRTHVFHMANGFPADALHGWEDWALWLRLLKMGCRFACVEQPTWLYRLHPGSKTFNGEIAAT